MRIQNVDDRVTISLAIESVNLAASSITAQLGVLPSREWLKATTRGKTGKRWEQHGWMLEVTACLNENEGRPASELIPIVIREFESKVRPLAKSVSLLGESAERYIVLSIITSDVPSVELSHSLLQLLVDLGGTFQVDLNILG